MTTFWAAVRKSSFTDKDVDKTRATGMNVVREVLNVFGDIHQIYGQFRKIKNFSGILFPTLGFFLNLLGTGTAGSCA